MNQAASATRRPPADPTAAAGCCPMFSAPFFNLPSAATSSPQCVLRSQAQQLVQLARQQQQPNGAMPPTHHTNHQQQQPPRTQQHQQQPTVSQQQQQQQRQHQSNMIGRQLQQQQQQQQQQLHSQQLSPTQQQQQQQPSQGPQDYTSTDYSTSAPGVSLQHLLAGRHPASSCMALAAALASASFPHLQQPQQTQQLAPPPLPQQLQQNHQQVMPQLPPMNQSTNNSNSNTNTNISGAPVSTLNTTSSAAATPLSLSQNQVPTMLNYSSYPPAQHPSFLNLPTLNVQPQPPQQQQQQQSSQVAPAQSQQAPPMAAHLGSTVGQQQQQQQTSSIPNLGLQGAPSNSNAPNNLRTVQQTRPLVANTSLNSVAGQQSQQAPGYRNTQQQQQQGLQVPSLQHQPLLPMAAQQLGQVTRSILSDEALNSLFNDQFQTFLLYQLFSNHQFAPPSLGNPNTQQPQPQVQQVNASRPPPPPPTLLPAPTGVQGPAAVMIPAQQQQQLQNGAPSTQTVTQQLQPSEQVSENQQQSFHSAAQSRSLHQAPGSLNPMAANSLFQSQPQLQQQAQQQPQQLQLQQPHRPHVDMSLQPQQLQQQAQAQIVIPSPPPLQAEQQLQQPQQQPQQQQQPPLPPQQQQPQSNLSAIPFYSFPQMEQALALLANPQNADNIFSHLFNIYLQSGLRPEPHNQHHAQHFHHHLHGPHHHHHNHHGQDGQPTGQDATIPLDSMAINESKPRGLSRVEIDSLKAHLHMNEKDSRTCVICLSKFEFKAKIRPLSCNHEFHAKCVDKWLKANRTCPICRRDALNAVKPKVKKF